MVNITKEDIGCKVQLRNGDIELITEWRGNSVYPVCSGRYRVYTQNGSYIVNEECELDIVKMFRGSSEDSERKVCIDHQWAGSGFAGGMVFCKICDVTYNYHVHGDSGL